MRWFLNGIYLLLLTILSPVILWRSLKHGRYRRGLAEKLLGKVRLRQATQPVVCFHAVSVGEVIQLQKVVEAFRQQCKNRFQVLITTSTDTGYDLAVTRFPDCTVTWFPLDFSWAVSQFLNQVRPSLLVLMELELWPNMLAECSRRNVPAAVINARISDRSYRGYSKIRPLLHPLISRLALVAAQTDLFAERLVSLGARPERTHVTGSVKFDGVAADRDNPKTQALRKLLRIGDHELIFIAGSTQAPEEGLALDAWRRLSSEHSRLRLILVPRHRERFDEVAELVRSKSLPLIRRSGLPSSISCAEQAEPDQRPEEAPASGQPAPPCLPVILLDTIGELSACWGLADIAFVGGSFGSRGGQNMMEPAGYGAAVMFGPNTWNFRDVVAAFQSAEACVRLETPDDLKSALARLLQESEFRAALGRRARDVVIAQQGATDTTVSLLLELLEHD